jgi:HSP20 family molecular chaperone IbpA
MSRTLWFESPLLLGFERLHQLAQRTAQAAADGYPPYNVEAVSDDALLVTLAVAGFEPDELAVEIEDRQLAVTGEKTGEGAERSFLHRGIATRRFRRMFYLADGFEVTGAALENGLLHIDVKRPDKSRGVRKVAISATGASGRTNGKVTP